MDFGGQPCQAQGSAECEEMPGISRTDEVVDMSVGDDSGGPGEEAEDWSGKEGHDGLDSSCAER